MSEDAAILSAVEGVRDQVVTTNSNMMAGFRELRNDQAEAAKNTKESVKVVHGRVDELRKDVKEDLGKLDTRVASLEVSRRKVILIIVVIASSTAGLETILALVMKRFGGL